MNRRRPHLLRRLLGLSPLLVGLLWLAGVSRFRHYDLTGKEWSAVVACGFALHLLNQRVMRRKPLPPLPADTSPAALALLAGAMLGMLAGVVGGVFEWAVQPLRPSEVGWLLRTTWHAACAFGASYCTFLARLQDARSRTPGAGGTPMP